MRIFQGILLWLYKFFKQTGLLENELFQSFFSSAYFTYKQYFEDPFWGLIRKYPRIFKGGNILDIGANIGYTSFIFSKVISPGFQVYAFEPERENFVALKKTIKIRHMSDRVFPIQAAIGEKSGEVELWHNENHHADHRILTKEYKKSGVNLLKVSTIPMWSVDQFVELEMPKIPIKFIKIDVQGYELPVCLGMQETLKNNSDLVVILEYSPSSMSELGFAPEELFKFFDGQGYWIYLITHKGSLELIKNNDLNRIYTVNQHAQKRGYVDLLFAQKELFL